MRSRLAGQERSVPAQHPDCFGPEGTSIETPDNPQLKVRSPLMDQFYPTEAWSNVPAFQNIDEEGEF
jgi:hypothetical protein